MGFAIGCTIFAHQRVQVGQVEILRLSSSWAILNSYIELTYDLVQKILIYVIIEKNQPLLKYLLIRTSKIRPKKGIKMISPFFANEPIFLSLFLGRKIDAVKTHALGPPIF